MRSAPRQPDELVIISKVYDLVLWSYQPRHTWDGSARERGGLSPMVEVRPAKPRVGSHLAHRVQHSPPPPAAEGDVSRVMARRSPVSV